MSKDKVSLPTDKRWMKYDYSFAWVTQACSRCSNCKYVHPWYIKSQRFSTICPSLDYYMFDAYSSQGRMDIGLALGSGKLKLTKELAESLYKCTLCGACDTMCKMMMDMEPLRVLRELRVMCARAGLGPLPKHKAYAKSIEENYNPYKEPHEKRFAWMPNEVKPVRKADVVYFVGCTSAYRRPEIAQATVKILNAAGVKFAVMGPDEYCCGSPILRVGLDDLAKKVMDHNIKTVNKLGAKTLITTCAGCFETLYADVDEVSDVRKKFDVIHTPQYIDTLIDEGKLKFKKPLDLKVTYHDPCHLVRPAREWKPMDNIGNVDLFETPRKILKKIPGLELVEMERIKELSYCCGAGGGVKAAFPDFALGTAKYRLEEAQSTGAEALVTCCPFCKQNLQDAAEGTYKVYDLVDCILETL